MGSTQVTSFHPVQVGATLQSPVIVKNLSEATVYYKSDPSVSSSTKDGELTENQEVTITNSTWFVTKEKTDTEIRVSPANLALPSTALVGTANLEASAVTEPKLGAEAVASGKIKKPSVPVPAAGESLTAVAGVAGGARMMTFAYTAKHEASAKVKLIHNLNTEMVVVWAFKTSSKLPSEKIADGAAVAGAISKAEPVSANETLVTLVATEPAAKEEFLYVVIG